MQIGKPVNRPDHDETSYTAKPRVSDPGTGRPRRTPQYGLADADIKARTGRQKKRSGIRRPPENGMMSRATSSTPCPDHYSRQDQQRVIFAQG